MALTLSTAARNGACNGVVDLIDNGTSLGKLKLFTSGATLLCTNLFANPAFGDSATGVATANAIANGTAVADGTANNASVTDGADGVIISGLTVAAGSGDVNLNSVTITTGDIISITSMTVTQPAS